MSLSKKILKWFDKSGRKDLPWQQNKTPYRVWVSEIMLQQTQVQTVIPYFLNFMKRFPDIETLAQATEDEVLHFWTGLGYYSRARNLLRSAKIITQELKKFPDEVSELEKLPGIGRSTAGAIISIAFEKRAPILDGNVKRVLTRLHAIEVWPGEKEATEKLWKIAENYTPTKRVADYTQAIMDLGATLCVRGTPLCEKCPLTAECEAHHRGIQKELPKSKPAKKIPTRESTFLILQNKNCVLLEKRSGYGVWKGLWSLPEIAGFSSSNEIKKICEERFAAQIEAIKIGDIFRHTFSHFHLDILPVILCIKKMKAKIMEDNQQIWYNLLEPVKIGLPAPIKLILSNLK